MQQRDEDFRSNDDKKYGVKKVKNKYGVTKRIRSGRLQDYGSFRCSEQCPKILSHLFIPKMTRVTNHLQYTMIEATHL